MIGDHDIRRRQPLGSIRLRRHASFSVLTGHPSCHCPLQTTLVRGIHHDDRPIEPGIEERHLHHRGSGKPLQFGHDPAEDQWMSDRLQGSELDRIVEDDAGEQLAVYLAFENGFRPSLGDLRPRFVAENGMADGIGVDRPNSAFGQ